MLCTPDRCAQVQNCAVAAHAVENGEHIITDKKGQAYG